MAGRTTEAGTRAAGTRLLPLVPFTAAVIVLASTGLVPTWPGLVHLVALPPLDLFGDVRVLLTATSGPVSFTVLLLAVLAVRVVLPALMTGGLTRRRIALAAAFYGVQLVPVLPAAEAVYITGTLLYARLFWGGVAAVAVLALVSAPLPWRAENGRVREVLAGAWRDGFRVGVILGYAAAVIGIGALAHLFPGLTIALVPVSAAATAAAITLLSHPAAPGGTRRLGAAAMSAVLLVWVWTATREAPPAEPARPPAGSIMLMSGIDSHSGAGNAFRSRTDLLGYGCDQTYG